VFTVFAIRRKENPLIYKNSGGIWWHTDGRFSRFEAIENHL
jgi:hypothetical protein